MRNVVDGKYSGVALYLVFGVVFIIMNAYLLNIKRYIHLRWAGCIHILRLKTD